MKHSFVILHDKEVLHLLNVSALAFLIRSACIVRQALLAITHMSFKILLACLTIFPIMRRVASVELPRTMILTTLT